MKMQEIISEKQEKIDNLEEIISEFEEFLKQNPDIRAFYSLNEQILAGDRRIHELENWIEKNSDVRIERIRIMELEEMVTSLEDYVKSHNVDSLKKKLQDREDKIVQLREQIETNLSTKILQRETTTTIDQLLSLRDVKIKEMEEEISEKNTKLQKNEKQKLDLQAKIDLLTKEDIAVLKKKIRVRDERVGQLENEIESLERALNERIEDLEHIEDLINVIKEKEDKECQLKLDLKNSMEKNEKFKEALCESIKISNQGQNKIRAIEKTKRNALVRIEKLEQRITSMQSASAIKCHTCRPLLKKLNHFANQRITQLKDLHHIKREALRATLSEKDAQVALLELSGIKTEKLKSDREQIIDQLKDEDKKYIELSEEITASSEFSSSDTPALLTKILEPIDDDG